MKAIGEKLRGRKQSKETLEKKRNKQRRQNKKKIVGRLWEK